MVQFGNNISRNLSSAEDGYSMFLQNIGTWGLKCFVIQCSIAGQVVQTLQRITVPLSSGSSSPWRMIWLLLSDYLTPKMKTLWSSGTNGTNNTSSYPRILKLSATQLWGPQISHISIYLQDNVVSQLSGLHFEYTPPQHPCILEWALVC
jgi:hypothetical protein